MALWVLKFGGTSVGSPERIEAVADKIKTLKAQGHDLVVVVSAMSGETNRLIGLARQIQEDPEPRELDALVSTGEQVSVALFAMATQSLGVEAVKKWADEGAKPENTPGKDFFDTGVALITFILLATGGLGQVLQKVKTGHEFAESCGI